MILVDTSVWIDHLRLGESLLVTLLERNDVLAHPWIIGELAVGNLRNRGEILDLLHAMPQGPMVPHQDVLALIEDARLYGLGLGYVDAHLLASAHVGDGTLLWTRDRRLNDVAARMGIAFDGSALTP